MIRTTVLLAAAAVLAAAAPREDARAQATAAPGYFSSPERHGGANLDRVRKAYVSCLKSENDGVVESALAHTAWMLLLCPDGSCDQLRGEINRLAVSGRTPAIRYKAYLASLVTDHPAIFGPERERRYAGPDELFAALAGRLQKTLLGSADRVWVGS